MQTRWQNFREQLIQLTALRIPRRVLTNQLYNMQLHCFCDASERVYGAVIYVRSVDTNGQTTANLITAKSRVSHLNNSRKQKRICLPRLELSAALLSTHLYDKVINTLKTPVETFFWSDFTIALHWLVSNPSRWKTFVANRVSKIQHMTLGIKWCHVSEK